MKFMALQVGVSMAGFILPDLLRMLNPRLDTFRVPVANNFWCAFAAALITYGVAA